MNDKSMSIEITEREPERAEFTRDGTTRIYYKQWAIMTIDGLPTAFEFSVDEPLKPGPAVLSPKSFGVDKGRLTLTRATLIPVAAAKAAPITSPKAA